MSRISPDATAFHHRGAAHEVHAIAAWDGDENAEAAVVAVQQFATLVAPFGVAGYVNIVPGNTLDWLRAACVVACVCVCVCVCV